MSENKNKRISYKLLFSILAITAILSSLFGGYIYFESNLNIDNKNNEALAALNCPAGSTLTGGQCISNTPSGYTCPSGGTPDGVGNCIRNLCPNGDNPANGGNCSQNQLIVWGCGAGDPNTIYRATHNGFDSSLCTAPQNRGFFSQVGSCASGFRAGGSRNRGGLPYTYNVRSEEGPEPFYDTYFGYGDSADTLLRDRRTNDAFQAMCNDGSRLCPAGQGLAFYAARSTKHLPLAGAGQYLCVSYSIPNSYLPVFFAGGWSYSYRADPGYYPYPRDPSFQNGVSCRSYSAYATGGMDNFSQVMAGANEGGELSFYCAPNNFAPPVSSNYAATPQFNTVVSPQSYTIDINTGISNCTPSVNSISSGNTFNCTFNLSGSPIGTYEIPPQGLFAGIRNITGDESSFLGNSSLCSVSGTVLTCNNIPTTGATTGSKEIILHQPLVNWYPNKGNINLLPNSTPLTALDIPGLTVNCGSAAVNNTTTCTFPLPSNKTLPSDFKLSIGSGAPGGTCIATGSSVSCVSVPTGNSIRNIPIYGNLGSGSSATKTNTGENVIITGVNFAKADWTFNPTQGSNSPLFRSTTNTAIAITNLKTIFDPTPSSNTRYTCMMHYRALNSRNASTPTWNPLSTTQVPYNTTTGCTFNFTKAQRANALNHSLRLTITDTSITAPSVSNPNTFTLYNEYIFRFQGSGTASGG